MTEDFEFSARRGVLGSLAALGLAALLPATSMAAKRRSGPPPGVELVDITQLGATGGRQRFALTFLVSNPGAEDLVIQDLRYTVRLSGQGFIRGAAGQGLTVPAGGRQTLRAEIETDTVASLASVRGLDAAPDGELSYELTGELVLGGRPPRHVGFAFADNVPFGVARND